MALIKEPLNINFYFSGKEMTEENQNRVSDYIKQQKEKKKAIKSKSKGASKQNA
jgi:hypothetical protein